MLLVPVNMNQVLRSVRLKNKRLSGLTWATEVLVVVLIEERDVAMDMVVAVVRLEPTPAC